MQRIAFIFLHALSSIQFWLSRRLTNVGKFVLAVLVISAAVGIDTDLTLAHQIFTLLVALFIFSFISNISFNLNFEVNRVLPPFVTAGETFQYQIYITNLGNNTKEGLLLIETLADPRPTYNEYLLPARTKDKSKGSNVNAYRRWEALISEKMNGDIKEQQLPKLLNKHVVEVSIEASAKHRGHIDFTETIIARLDPFGLFKTFAKTSTRQTLLVLPKRYSLPALQLPGKRIYQHGGVTLAASKGDTEEFIGLRDYREGERRDDTEAGMTRPLPMQPIERDSDGVVRFRANAIVRWLLDAGPFDMNQIGLLPGISQEDREQFYQLIGYSVSGYGELGLVSEESIAEAESASGGD